jgi:hypothetical protein
VRISKLKNILETFYLFTVNGILNLPTYRYQVRTEAETRKLMQLWQYSVVHRESILHFSKTRSSFYVKFNCPRRNKISRDPALFRIVDIMALFGSLKMLRFDNQLQTPMTIANLCFPELCATSRH